MPTVPQVMRRQNRARVHEQRDAAQVHDQRACGWRKIDRKFFCCDAVLDTKSRQIEIHSGWAGRCSPMSWKTADKRTYVHWAEKKYDIIASACPPASTGAARARNPIQMMQALSWSSAIGASRRRCIVHRVLHLRRLLPRRALALPAGAVRPVQRLHEHPPDMNRYGRYFAAKGTS